MGLKKLPLCRRRGEEEEEEVLAHVLCECEALVSLRHTHLGSFLLDPKDVKES